MAAKPRPPQPAATPARAAKPAPLLLGLLARSGAATSPVCGCQPCIVSGGYRVSAAAWLELEHMARLELLKKRQRMLDWAEERGLTVTEYQDEMIISLDSLQTNNLRALLLSETNITKEQA